MTQKIALVTGASSGFGAIIAKQLAQDGYYVFASARRMHLLEAMSSNNIEALQLDVTKEADIHTAINHIIESKGQIDLLVNNAGFGLYGTIEETPIDSIKYQFEVNYFAVTNMVKAVLPHMREKRAGMIINMASLVGHVAMPMVGYYASTKHALEAFSDALRMEVAQFNIKTVLIEPGTIKTEFQDVAFDGLKRSPQLEAYDALVRRMKRGSEKRYANAPGPELVAQAVHKAVSAKHPKRRYAVGKDAKAMIFIKRTFGYGLIDRMFAKILKTGN